MKVTVFFLQNTRIFTVREVPICFMARYHALLVQIRPIQQHRELLKDP